MQGIATAHKKTSLCFGGQGAREGFLEKVISKLGLKDELVFTE